ncbi:MAG: hypothetical protein JW750_01335 [Anaerolineaceae bacterium]|nr:hypothetical protein [Anaerolineaceae bacterium]
MLKVFSLANIIFVVLVLLSGCAGYGLVTDLVGSKPAAQEIPAEPTATIAVVFPPEGTVEPAPVEGTEPETQAAYEQDARGWCGYIISDGDDDKLVLMPEGTGTMEISGESAKIDGILNTLRDKQEPGKNANLWGKISCASDDDADCEFRVTRVRNGAIATDPEPVENWSGSLQMHQFNQGESIVFVLDGRFPMWFSVHSNDADVLNQLLDLAAREAHVTLSGELMTGVPDANEARIQVSVVTPSGS